MFSVGYFTGQCPLVDILYNSNTVSKWPQTSLTFLDCKLLLSNIYANAAISLTSSKYTDLSVRFEFAFLWVKWIRHFHTVSWAHGEHGKKIKTKCYKLPHNQFVPEYSETSGPDFFFLHSITKMNKLYIMLYCNCSSVESCLQCWSQKQSVSVPALVIMHM